MSPDFAQRIKRSWLGRGYHVSVPFSRLTGKKKHLWRSYGWSPIEDVPFAQTAFAKAFEKLTHSNPLALAEFQAFWDHRARPLIRQAQEALDQALDELGRVNDRIDDQNAKVQAELESISSQRQKFLEKWQASTRDLLETRTEAVLASATTFGEAGFVLDLDGPLPANWVEQLLMKEEAYVAREHLPFNVKHRSSFLEEVLEWLFTLIVGAIEGVSAAAAANLIHASNLPREIPQEIVAALFGIAVTTKGGYFLRNVWRTVAEDKHLGRPIKHGTIKASLATGGAVLLTTAIDMRGLLAAQGVRDTLAQLAPGAPAHSGPSGFTLFLVGAFAGAFYFAYESISGYRKYTDTLESQIVLAKEKDRMAEAARLRALPQWNGMMGAGNTVAALDTVYTDREKTFTKIMETFSKREKELEASLKQHVTTLPETAVFIIERARIEAEGAQIELDRRFKALLTDSYWKVVASTFCRRSWLPALLIGLLILLAWAWGWYAHGAR